MIMNFFEPDYFERYLAKLPSFGGGGDGGGGSSGRVSYPPYMEGWHGDVLNQTTDIINISVTDAMNAAFGNSPFTVETAYDPNVEVAAILAASSDLDYLVDLLSKGTGLDTLVSSVLDNSRVTTAIADFDDAITDLVNQVSIDLTSVVAVNQIPKFEAGMRDIGAVVSSAFPIGRAIIDKEVVNQTAKIAGELRLQQAKFASDLHNKVFSETALAIIQLKLQYQYQLSALAIEANRLKIVAKKEEVDTNLEIVKVDATWDLEVFKYGSNVLGSIAGTAVSQGSNLHTGSSVGSAIGGAFSGVAAGAMIGGGPGGAIIGGLLGMASGFLR